MSLTVCETCYTAMVAKAGEELEVYSVRPLMPACEACGGESRHLMSESYRPLLVLVQ
jgi:hypothetical protein